MKLFPLTVLAASVVFTAPLSRANLIGLYTFDEAATPLNDSSGANNHLTIAAGTDPVWSATLGLGGTGAYDYSLDRLIAPIDVNATAVPKLTWGAWVRTDLITSGTRKILGHDNGDWDRTIGLDNRTPATLRYTTFVGNDPINNLGPLKGTPGPVNITDWTFVAAVYDQEAKTVSMYVDLEATSTADALVAVTEPGSFGPGATTFAIGGISPANTGEAWDGVIDNVFVYNEALPPEKLTLIRNRGLNELKGIYNDPRIEATRPTKLYGSLAFGTVPAVINRTVVIKNLGAANTLTISAPAISGANAANYSIVSAPSSLAPGASGNLVVALAPGPDSADYAANLTITSNDPDSPPIVIPLNASVTHYLSENLIGLYTFDDSANRLKDSSGYRNNITGTAGTDPVWGPTTGFNGSGAYEFSSDRLIVPINVNATVLPRMSWGAWVRTNTLTSGLYKVLGHDDGAWDRTIGLDNRNPAIFRYTGFTGTANNSGPVENTPSPVSTTNWTFIAATYDNAAQTMTMFVDLDASSTTDPVVAVTELAGFGPGAATFAIGGISPTNAGEAWVGAIDNVFVYKDALTPAKITAIRNRGLLELSNIPVGDPDILLSPASLFGDLTGLGPAPGPVSRSVTISNTGATQPLTVSAITVTGANQSRYSVTPPLPAPIPPGGSANVQVVFTPPAAGGTSVATLNVSSNDEDTPVATASLTATVTTDPNADVQAFQPLFGRMTFHALPASISRTVIVKNTGVANTLTVNAPVISGADAARYSIISTPASILPGAQAELTVTLSPLAAATYSASLQITTNDADSPGFTIPLDGSVVIVPPATLTAFYSFDDSANPLKDDSGNAHTLSLGIGADPVWGATTGFSSSGAYLFTSDSLICPIDINPGVMPQMSWGAWVRTDTLVPALYKVMGHDNGGYDRTMGLDPRPENVFHYTTFTGTGVVAGTPGPVNTTDWTFLAATYDQTAGTATMYVDLNAATTNEPLRSATEAASFGAGFGNFAIGDLRPDGVSEPWAGSIDNVFVYSGILSDEEIRNLRDNGKSAALGAQAAFEVTNWHINANGTVTLTWRSEPGALYTVRYNFDLTNPVNAWPDDADDVVSQGAITTYTTNISFAANRRVFFSVQKN
ncbi:MAG TPA: LamG-like jellyroll fold domain-containing protein [Verrucomicrobiales bacterium]|nr:LamG-like jellyroll fold domain-containing protein [Verrucomicrobiales bacterium]